MARLTNLVVFLISLHVLFFFAGSEGLRPAQSGGNPHEAFYTNISGTQVQDAATAENDSGILGSDFRVPQRSLSWVNVVGGFLTSPYSVFDNTRIPAFWQVLGKAILGFLEAAVVAMFLRGVLM